jgi:hypothetical protein
MFFDQDFEGLAGIRSDLDFFLWTGELEDYFGAGWLKLTLDCLDYEEE